jgi:hypothetical protein
MAARSGIFEGERRQKQRTVNLRRASLFAQVCGATTPFREQLTHP